MKNTALPEDPRYTNHPLPTAWNSLLANLTPAATPNLPEAPITSSIIDQALRHHNQRYRTLLFMRFAESLTAKEVGEHLGVSRQRANQLEAKALKALRVRGQDFITPLEAFFGEAPESSVLAFTIPTEASQYYPTISPGVLWEFAFNLHAKLTSNPLVLTPLADAWVVHDPKLTADAERELSDHLTAHPNFMRLEDAAEIVGFEADDLVNALLVMNGPYSRARD